MGDEAQETEKTWRKMGVEGLYLHGPSGTYYSRFRLNGKRTFRSLKTKKFAVAKLRHAKTVGEREEARQTGVTLNADFRTLGDLAEELERRISASTSDQRTKENQRYALLRLRRHWPGAFDRTVARTVTLDTVISVRHHLLKNALVMKGRSKVAVSGYRPAVVNQTLGFLRMLLDIAVEKHVIPRNPFEERAILQEEVYLPKKTRRPQLPSRADLERVFAELLVIPREAELSKCVVSQLRVKARDVNEHVRFIAYSGMRVSEANASMVEDDHGDRMHVRGTKSGSSDRFIPVHPLLRALMDEIKARGTTGRFLRVSKSIIALERACKRLGLPKLTHHDLRHYFATICIEEGVDIPTVSRWLGHSDGGALAMRTYGHLRQEHSIAAMKRVSFAPRTAPTNGE